MTGVGDLLVVTAATGGGEAGAPRRPASESGSEVEPGGFAAVLAAWLGQAPGALALEQAPRAVAEEVGGGATCGAEGEGAPAELAGRDGERSDGVASLLAAPPAARTPELAGQPVPAARPSSGGGGAEAGAAAGLPWASHGPEGARGTAGVVTSPGVAGAPEPADAVGASPGGRAGDALAAAPSGPAAPAHGAGRGGGLPDELRVDRDLRRLNPELRARLERVVKRMREEFGHEVRVVEGYRSQARQAHLYEQGRTRPGPIVTWTLASAHTEGRAVDVVIDGTYDAPEAYARLAQVAREEGLRTLGPRDPGHLELPEPAAAGGGNVGGGGGVAPLEPIARVAPVASIEPIARVAAPARVAPVAPVAPVARVDAMAWPAGTAAAAQGAAAGKLAGAGSGRDRGAGDATGEASGSRRRAEPGTLPADSPAHAVWTSPSGSTAANGPATGFEATGPDVAGRIARVLELQESGALPSSSVWLRLGDEDGGIGRIRVGLRGSAVDARIWLDDPAAAQRLTDRVEELARALRGRGLEPETLRIHGHGPTADAAEALRSVFRTEEGGQVVASAAGPGAWKTTESEEHRAQPHGHSSRQEPDPNRHRSRREHSNKEDHS